MKGLFYHNFILAKGGLINLGLYQLLFCAFWIIFGIIGDSTDVTEMAFVGGMLCLVSFFMISLTVSAIFSQDEKLGWCYFIMSSPDGIEGQVAGKYKFLFLIDMMVLALWYILDLIMPFINEQIMPLTGVALVFFSLMLILFALDLPCMIRLGATIGGNFKWVLVSLAMLGFIIYGLFGDISFFQSEDPVAALFEMLSGETFVWIFTLLPYIAVVLYLISYKVSVMLYRKGVDAYEQ